MSVDYFAYVRSTRVIPTILKKKPKGFFFCVLYSRFERFRIMEFLSFTVRVGSFVNIFHMLHGNVGVNLGVRNSGMTQKLLHNS